MKKNLEFKDEKSHKFWQIEVLENTFTVTYGKVGTNGQSKTKEFDTAEKANLEAEKAIKQKLKKGYQEISNIIVGKQLEELVKVFLYSDFKKLNKLELLKKDAEIINNLERDNTQEGESYIALIEEDVVFEKNLFVDGLFNSITEKFAKDKSVQAIWFAGKVTVNGTMYNTEKEDYSDAIIFEKSVKAKNIVSGGTSLYFLDKVESQVLYVQIQSEGLLSFKQNTENAFQIRVDDNQIWKKNKERFDFAEDGEEITAENLDKFLLNKDAFFVIDEDYENEEEDYKTVHYYNLEEDELFVEAIISGKEIFNLK